MLPRTPEQYGTQIAEKLNWLERLLDDATGTDERLDVTNRLLIEILRVSTLEKETFPFPPALSRALIDHLTKDKPEFYKFIDIDLSEARTNEPYLEAGNFIWIDNQFARGEVTLKLNEETFDAFDLRRQRFIEGPFYRFFIDNVAGQGTIRLFISRGYQVSSQPVEGIDRAELAARLGSIVTFDRRGDVVWFDDFTQGVEKWAFTGDTGAALEWSSASSKFGGFSCKLISGSSKGYTARIGKLIVPQPLSRVGIEWCFTTEADLAEILFMLNVDDATTRMTPFIKYLPQDGKLQYLDAEDFSEYQDFATDLTIYPEATMFHTLKIVADINKREYVRCLVDNISYDMSGIAFWSADSIIEAALINVRLQIEPNDGSSPFIYVDHVIVTQNEP